MNTLYLACKGHEQSCPTGLPELFSLGDLHVRAEQTHAAVWNPNVRRQQVESRQESTIFIKVSVRIPPKNS